MPENTIDTLKIKVDADIKDAQKNIQKFSGQMKRNFTFDPSGLKVVSQNIANLGKGLKGIGEYGKNFHAVKKITKSIDQLGESSKRAAELASKMNRTFQDAKKYSYADFSNVGSKNQINLKDVEFPSLREIANEELLTSEGLKNARKETERFKSVLRGLGKIITLPFNLLYKSAKTTVSVLRDIVSLMVKIAKTGIIAASRKFSSLMTGINKKISYFGWALKNTIVYGTIHKTIKAISEAVKNGTDNLYQYSKLISGTFASSMDTLSSSLQYFQNSIGSAISPLINTLTPAIDSAVDHIVEFINSLNQLFAKLTGASTWTKAVKVQKEYAEAADSAAESNKGLLASFDELNVIQSQSGTSASNAVDYGSMFEEIAIEDDYLPDFVQKIRDQIEDGNWAGIGQTLGEKVNEVIEKINWSEAGEKLGHGLQSLIDTYNNFMGTVDWSGIGNGLSEALNNLMANVDPESLGAAFAQKWNALFELIHGFITTTNWAEVGKFISGTINGWFDTIDWTLVGKTVSDGIKSLLIALRTAVQETNWKSIVDNISEMLSQIDWSGIFEGTAGLISDAVKGLLDLMIAAVEEIEWDKLGNELWNNVISSVISIDFAGIADRFFTLWGEALAADRKFSITFWKIVAEKLTEGFSNLFTYFGDKIEECGGDIGEGILKGINDAWNNVGTWIYDHIFKPFIDGFKKIWGIASPAKEMIPLGEYIILGLLEGFKDSWSNIETWISDSFEWVKTTITDTFTSAKETATKIFEGMWNSLKSVINSILGGVEKMANGVVDGINAMIKALNGLSFDVPDWVPIIGGETFGFDIKTLQKVSIPRLAHGGVVTGPSIVEVGEYSNASSNPEIISPKNIIYQTVLEANSEQNQLLREQNSLLRQLLNKESSVTIAPSAALGRVNARSAQMYEAIVGG